MALKTTPYDSAEYLRTEEERAAYLAACMEEAPEDAAFITHALGVVARSRNMSQLARDTGLTREGLYKALSDSGNPSFEIGKASCRERVCQYVSISVVSVTLQKKRTK